MTNFAPAAVLLAATLFSACATTPHNRPIHEAFRGNYEFTAQFAGDVVTGSIEFLPADHYPVRYRMLTSHSSCNHGEIRNLQGGRRSFRCGPVSVEFLRNGRLVGDNARATLYRTEMVRGPNRCVEYATDPRTGRRYCARSEPSMQPRTVQVAGTAEIRRESLGF